LPLNLQHHESWDALFESQQIQLEKILKSIDLENIVPPFHQLFRVFETPVDTVKIVIVGQDPYPTFGDANGLAFSSAVSTIPRSLKNIFKELADDLGNEERTNSDLQDWSDQGVFLINRVLSTAPGVSLAHRGIGWESFTAEALDFLIELNPSVVPILWGSGARELAPLFKDTLVIESAHPSPLSAHRGFFGSKPFSRANHHLVKLGLSPIEWG
jgi:uracil-DNA glycosylase